MKIYFLLYHVRPGLYLERSVDVAGAYVSCWVEAISVKQADSIARHKIVTAKWNIRKREDAYEINAEDYLQNPIGLEFYNQALLDKWVLRFHTYPHG